MQVHNTIHPPQTTPIDPTPEQRQTIIALVDADKMAEMVRFGEGLMPQYPHSFMLFYSVGMGCTLLAEFQKALAYLQKATAINPNSVNAWRYQGDCCLQLELHDEARRNYEKALQINPEDMASRRGLTQSMVDLKNFAQSVTRLEKIVEEDAENPHLLVALSQCYLEQEKYLKAIRALEKALTLLPDDIQVMTLLGQAYADFHKPKDALALFEKVLERDKPRPMVLTMMANAAKDKGDFEASIAYGKEAIALNPDGAAPKNNLAHIWSILGDKGQSTALREEVLADNPEDINAIIGLANTTVFAEATLDKNATRIKTLESLYQKPPSNYFEEKQRMHIGFALGKIYGDSGQYKKSVQTLTQANAKRRELLEFDFTEEVKGFELIKHVFAPITPDDCVAPNPDDRQMIFILGMPRSGTTLVEQILSSHSAVYGAGELNFMNEETAELMYMFGLQPDVALKKIAFEHIRPKYLAHIDDLGMKERIITDKLPHNFLRLGYILCCFPEAKVIHLNRDPVAVCFSCFQKFFPARGMGFTFDMRDLGLYYGMYLDLMAYWRKKFPGRILDLDYQALTENQESQTRMLLEHCDLPWEAQCLEFYNTQRGVLTASQTQVRERMYQGSSAVWKKYKAHLGALLDALDEAGVEWDRTP